MTVEADTLTPVVEVPAAIVEAPAATPVKTEPSVPRTLREDIESAVKSVNGRTRDEVGRFAKEQKAAADAASADPQSQVQAKPAAPVKAERPADMPKAWGQQQAAYWATLSPEAKAYITERETRMEEFHAKHAGIAQWQEAAAQNGTTLPEVLDRVHRVETTMIQSPDQGLVMACEMVGMDRNAAVRALQGALARLGVQGGQQQGQPQGQPQGNLPPIIQDMATKLQAIEQSMASQQQKEQASREVKAQAEVDAFFADPKNEFADQLKDDIARELRAMRAIGQEVNLPQAYERALWTRPDLRSQLLTKHAATVQAQAQSTRTQELEKSRSASRSVAGSPPLAEGRSSAEKPSSIREQLSGLMRSRSATV